MGLCFLHQGELKTVDPDKLRGVIRSDHQAVEDYMARRFSDCAARVNAIAPPKAKVCPLSRLGIIALHRANGNLAATVLQKLDAAAQINPMIAEVVQFMKAEARELPDFGIEEIRQALVAPVSFGGVGLTSQEAEPILAAGVEPDSTTPFEIETLRDREQWEPLSSEV